MSDTALVRFLVYLLTCEFRFGAAFARMVHINFLRDKWCNFFFLYPSRRISHVAPECFPSKENLKPFGYLSHVDFP